MWWLTTLMAFAQDPSATVTGSSIDLVLNGQHYDLSNSAVVSGRSVELHWEQPFADGYNQLWLVLGKVKKGQDKTLEGPGMYVAFVQIQTSPEESSTRNVSALCFTKGTARLDDKPKAGATASGAVDVTITCDEVPEIATPLVVRGTFSGIPVR